MGRNWHRLGLLIELPDERLLYLYKVESIPQARPSPPLDDLIRLAKEIRPDLAALCLGLDRSLSDLIAARQQLFEEKVRRRAQGQQTEHIPQRANVVRAELNAKQTQEQVARLEEQITSQVEQCHRECRLTFLEPTSLEKEIQAASQFRDAALRRYEADRSGVDEVRDAMHKYDVVDRRCLEALVKHRRIELELNTAVGMRFLP